MQVNHVDIVCDLLESVVCIIRMMIERRLWQATNWLDVVVTIPDYESSC